MKNFIIITNGFTFTGKSTAAKKIFKCLKNTDIFHSAFVREELDLNKKFKFKYDLKDPIFVKKVSKRVYSEMAKKAEKSIKKMRNVILDAAYNFYWQRKQIYDLGDKFNVEVYVLRCVCKDESEIRKRLEKRKGYQKGPLGEAISWETYISTIKYSELVYDDVTRKGGKPKIIEYDTVKNTVKIFNIDKDDVIKDIITKCLKK